MNFYPRRDSAATPSSRYRAGARTAARTRLPAPRLHSELPGESLVHQSQTSFPGLRPLQPRPRRTRRADAIGEPGPLGSGGPALAARCAAPAARPPSPSTPDEVVQAAAAVPGTGAAAPAAAARFLRSLGARLATPNHERGGRRRRRAGLLLPLAALHRAGLRSAALQRAAAAGGRGRGRPGAAAPRRLLPGGCAGNAGRASPTRPRGLSHGRRVTGEGTLEAAVVCRSRGRWGGERRGVAGSGTWSHSSSLVWDDGALFAKRRLTKIQPLIRY